MRLYADKVYFANRLRMRFFPTIRPSGRDF